MPKAVKTKSGKYRAIAYLGTDKEGKKIQKSFTADTKTEAEHLAEMCEMNERGIHTNMTKKLSVNSAVELYINKKIAEYDRGKISPTTINGYLSIQKTLIEDIKDIPCMKITDRQLQKWIDNLEDLGKAPKTIKNAYGLVRSSLLEVLPKHTVIDWRIELPTQTKKKVNVPSDEDISRLLNYFKENDYDMYLACILASFGTLRRSEICALTKFDIKGNVISVNKAVVHDLGQKAKQPNQPGMEMEFEFCTKGTKTESSTRDIIFPSSVIALIPNREKVVELNPNMVSKRFDVVKKKLGVNCCFHDLRHYSASIMHALGVPNEYIQSRGGWTNDSVLNEHYRGTIDEYDKKYTDMINTHLEKKFIVNE